MLFLVQRWLLPLGSTMEFSTSAEQFALEPETSAVSSVRLIAAPPLHEAFDKLRERVWQQVGDPHDAATPVTIRYNLEGCVVMSGSPFDDGVGQSACAIVHVDNPFAHHLTICEGDDPGVSLEPGVNHELLRKPCVDGAHVAYCSPNVFCWRVDREFLAN
jgi:hypothetical protein